MSRLDFAFEDTKPVICDRELLDAVRLVAAQLGAVSLPQRLYRLHGHYSTTSIKSRLGLLECRDYGGRANVRGTARHWRRRAIRVSDMADHDGPTRAPSTDVK